MSPNAFVAGAAASSPNGLGTFTVTTKPADTCTFTVSTTATWIHIQNGPSFTGTSQVTFALDSNLNSPQLRKDIITVTTPDGQSSTVTVTQLAGICNFTTSGNADHFPVSGGTGSFSITTGCPWSVTSNQGWLTLSSNSNFIGNGTVNYTAAANLCVAPRSATVTVQTGLTNPPVFQVAQDGSDANLSFSPAAATVGSGATVGRVAVNTGAGCGWSAYSDTSWLQITTPTGSGSGSGGITYSVVANTGPQRSARLHIGNAIFTVTQQGVGNPTPAVSTVVNGASYAAGPIAPGEIVALFGSNFGPPPPGVSYQLSSASGNTYISGLLSTDLVLFNGAPGPLLYVSSTQINVIVPYSVAGSATADIQVTYQGAPSNTLTVPVQAATPGLFSIDRSGQGPAAVLNQNYSVNSGASPAARGSTIMIYCTGAGVTAPAGIDGVITPLSQPFSQIPSTVPVQVLIGGVAANVVYAGDSPGSVAGLTQINAVVPNSVTPGASVPVVVTIGGQQSQSGVTVAVQ